MATTDAITSDPSVATALDQIKQTTNPSKSETDRLKFADDFQNFLRLLTTQLQHQDPTEPLDTNELTNQLALFAQVEQSIAANSNLETLIGLNSKVGVDAGVNYIGQVIEAKGDAGFLVGGHAPFIYSLSAPAERVDITIKDAKGNVVFSGNGSANEGKNIVTWDGINTFDGTTMPEGDYHITVTAIDGEGNAVETQTFTSGVVTAVEQEDGKITLTVGNLPVALEDVVAVRANQSSGAPEDTTSGADNDNNSPEDES